MHEADKKRLLSIKIFHRLSQERIASFLLYSLSFHQFPMYTVLSGITSFSDRGTPGYCNS
jgi:hypothetical protein